jgi:hypothetical protein
LKLPKDLQTFYATTSQSQPKESWPVVLQALWWDAKGNWEKSHELVDSLNTPAGCWVHAYLHRKEGDQWNAEYWYRKANKPVPEISLEHEFEDLVTTLLLT